MSFVVNTGDESFMRFWIVFSISSTCITFAFVLDDNLTFTVNVSFPKTIRGVNLS